MSLIFEGRLSTMLPISYMSKSNITLIRPLYLTDEKQGEIFHRFVLGSYKLLDKFTNKYPNVLLETCASGGGRFDLE